MMKKLSILILCGFFVQCVYAQEDCIALKANKIADSSQEKYVFKQHTFADGKTDLVIEQHLDNAFADAPSIPPVEIRRVTFGRGNAANSEATRTCFFQPLAFAEGGQGEQHWGWHMLWTESLPDGKSGGLMYARIDGEAWVSSNPKILTKLVAINPQFSMHSQSIIVTWQQEENGNTANMQAVSIDEGRSWEIAPTKP
jgi:hypothetical protein